MKFLSFYRVSRLIPFYLIILFVFSASYSFAQFETDRSSSISSLGSEQLTRDYMSSLSESQKAKILLGLNPEEVLYMYERLGDSERQEMVGLLSVRERKTLFQSLTNYEQEKMYEFLDDSSKQDLFSALNDENRVNILSNLNSIEKTRLLNSLSEMELARLVRDYPDIISDVDMGDIGAGKLLADDVTVTEKDIEKSRIENVFADKLTGETDRDLTQFGYDYFEAEPALSPIKYGPVTPDYILGPGDAFTVHLWGRAENTYNTTVSREGTITLPRLGTMTVSGMTFSELKTYLYNRFKEFYPEFEMSVNMGNLRTVDVYMIGELDKPGTYNLNSLSTAITALFAAGGAGKNGSLRNIKVSKDGKLIKNIDLYNFFINGSKGDDVRLQQGYTVFVPVIGPVAGIAGMVRRPAIYEMKGQQTLEEIIELAGGILPTGHLQNIVVERIAGHSRKIIKSFDLDPSSKKTDSNLKTIIEDGDLIKIFPIHTKTEKVVYLEGNVKYPREYEYNEGMRIKDIIPSYDYLLPEPYLPQAEILRLVPPDLHPEIIVFNLGAMLEGDEKENILLKDRDHITVYNAWEKRNLPEVSISGALRKPGVYRLYDGMTIKDLIFQAGNPIESAYLEKGELTRLVPGSSGMDLVKISFSPEKAMAGNPGDNLILQKNDLVHLREIPKYVTSLDKKVFMEGEFNFPGEYSFSEGERLSSVIKRAGGLTNEAYPYGAIFLRESVKSIQSERKTEYINRLEQDILTISAFSAETALDASQATIALQSLNAKKEMLEKLRAAEPTGRMVLDISEIILMPSGDNDIELRPGDKLIVSKRPDSVFILGEVFNPNAMVYKKDRDVGYYLNLVGGMTDNADKKQIYIVKADGTVISKEQGKFGLFNWDSENHRWGFGSFNSIKLLPGDTIIVPKKVLKFSWLKYFKDTTNVLYQIAVSAGVLYEVIKD